MQIPKLAPIKPIESKKQSLQEWHAAGGGVPLQYKGREHVWHAKVKKFAAGGDAHMGAGGLLKGLIGKAADAAKATKKIEAPTIIIPSKVSSVKEAVRQSKGDYGARRVERAADEIPNLERLYKEEALKRAFEGDNAKAMMTLDPSRFEEFATPIGLTFTRPNSVRRTSTGEQVTFPEYLEHLRTVDGFNDVPFLEINKKRQGTEATPFISNHEGRHRNRAMAQSGETSGLVQLLPRSELREPFPRRSQEDYIEALKKELEMTGNVVLPQINSNQPHLPQRRAIHMPDIYAKGGEVHMAGAGDPLDQFSPPRYRSAGRRPENQNDRRAAANMPMDLARGVVSGIGGAPGDIESFIRMLPGLDENTVLPTSEDIEKRLPFKSDTPAGRAATGLGTLAGGFYMGPGAPIRLVGGLPQAVYKAGKDFGRAAGQPAANVVKPTGGNFLTGRTEKDLQPLKSRAPTHRDEALLMGGRYAQEADTPEGIRAMAQTDALNKWVDSNLTNYVKKQMGTPDDPVRKLAEEGITHKPGLVEDENIFHWRPNLQKQRKAAGFPEEGMGQSPTAKTWERASDNAIATHRAGDIQNMPEKFAKFTEAERNMGAARASLDRKFAQHIENAGLNDREKASLIRKTSFDEKARMVGDTDLAKANEQYYASQSPMMDNYMELGRQNPYISKLDPETRLYAPFTNDLGFDHIMDVLREDLTTGRIRPEQMNKISMSDAVRRTYQYDQELAAKMNSSRAAAREGLPTYKEYPEGYRWVELNKPGSFANESEAMGHSVRGYEPPKGHPDWTEGSGDSGSSSYGHGGWEAIKSGKAKVYSLVDSKGAPHATVEIRNQKEILNPRQIPDDVMEQLKEQGKRIGNQKADAAGYYLYGDERLTEQRTAIDRLKDDWVYSNPVNKNSITQIKGKGNRAPNEEYLPYIQDFVKGGQWSDVGDIQNTGLRRTSDAFNETEQAFLKSKGVELKPYIEPEETARYQALFPRGPSSEGMAKGGVVRMGKGGAAKEIVEGAIKGVKKLFGTADEAPKGVEPIVVRTPEERAVGLQGALKPATAPVRGETSKELRKAQKKSLTNEEKESLELIKQKYPFLADAANFMTPQEVSKIISNPAAVQQMDRLLSVLPSAKELSSVAKAGAPKQGWYRASTQAIIDVFGVQDAPRFSSLLAAMSPQQSVEMNLLNTLNTWKNWTAAGRPTDPKAIKAIMGQSVSGSKLEDSVLDAWVNNATRSLSAKDPLKVTLSGPKVDSFYRNLADDVYRVTNDAWMANGLGVDQALFSGSPTALQLAKGDPGLSTGYIGTSARMREAGQQANMLPSEAQETTWSWFMPLYEMQRTTGLPARELLQRGMITPDVIRGTPDFSTLLNQGRYGNILKEAGYEGQLANLKPSGWVDPRVELTLSDQRNMERAAQRLENLKEGRGSESRSRSISLPQGKKTPETAFAYATPEYIPGRKTGHLETLIDAPESSRQHFSNRVSNVFQNPAGSDVLQSSLDLSPLKTRTGTGAYRAEGKIPFAGGRLGGESTSGRYPMEINPMYPSGVEFFVTSGLNVPKATQNKLTAAEAVRGYMTAQRGSPWNAQIPSKKGSNIFVPLAKKADPENMGYTSALVNGGVDLADTGAGVSVLNWGKNLTAEEKKQLTELLGGTGFQPTKHAGDYVDYGPAWEAGEGSGRATKKMLENVEKLSPKAQGALSQASQQPAGDLLDIYKKTAETKKGMTRADLMRALEIIRDKGLPGLAAALAAGEALPAEPADTRSSSQ